MLKTKIKSILIGILIGAVMTGGATWAAATYSTSDWNDVITDGINIVVDNKAFYPTDANGNPVSAIAYEGTTYLPVRAVSNAVGKAVYWDGPSFTVYLGDMNGTLKNPTATLDKMTNIGDRYLRTIGVMTDNYGNRYTDAFRIDTNSVTMSSPKCLEYLLNYKYSKFKATFFIEEGSTFDGSVYFKIIADGTEIYTSPFMTKTSHPLDVEVDVTGYNDVQIIPYRDDKGFEMHFANAGFYQ